jgi:ribokinase
MKTRFDVAVMHDYFVDRLVHVRSLVEFAGKLAAKEKDGGGGIHGIPQEQIRGGNAVNLARALAKLGLRTLLLTHSDQENLGLLKDAVRGLPLELRVRPLRAGMTVAFEGKENVMLGDGGGAADFGPEALDDGDWDALAESPVVCTVNWAANKKGTELLRSVRSRLGREVTIFMDPADFRDRIPEFRRLLNVTSREHLVDWMSMNEEEARAACGAMGARVGGLPGMCLYLAGKLGVSMDLHADSMSCRSDGLHTVRAPVTPVRARRLTGAGDVWDAGSIYGRLMGWEDRRALGFANAAARLYLKNPAPEPPGLEDVLAATL